MFGQEKPFPGISFIYLKKNRQISVIQGRFASATRQHITFDGYVRLRDGHTISVVQESEKEKAMQRLQQMGQDLQVEVRDLTEAILY